MSRGWGVGGILTHLYNSNLLHADQDTGQHLFKAFLQYFKITKYEEK